MSKQFGKRRARMPQRQRHNMALGRVHAFDHVEQAGGGRGGDAAPQPFQHLDECFGRDRRSIRKAQPPTQDETPDEALRVMAPACRPSRLDRSVAAIARSEEHTSELQSPMRNSYSFFCLTTKT